MFTLSDVSEQYPLILSSLAEARSFSCLMGQLPRDLSAGVHHIASQIHPNDVLHAAFEENEYPHVTVLYGLHTTNPDEVFAHLKRNNAVRPLTMTLGDLDVFRHRDQDVLKINVHSPDLDHLHSVAKKLPNSFSFPSYNPHVTVAYLKPGLGEKYIGITNHLDGREVTIGGLTFSTPKKRISYIPMRAPSVEDVVDLSIAGFDSGDLIEMTTAMAVGTLSRPFGFVQPVFPSFTAKSSSSKRSRTATPEAFNLRPSRQLQEGLDDFPINNLTFNNHLNYTDLPAHLRIMDELEGKGWEHFDDGSSHSHFRHEYRPKVTVYVRRKDKEPLWTVSNKKVKTSGSDIGELHKILDQIPLIEPDHGDDDDNDFDDE